MIPVTTSSIVRSSAPQNAQVDYVNPNAQVRGNAIVSGVPLVEASLFIGPNGQQQSSLKITSNSIAEASATPGQLDALTRALPQSLISVSPPRPQLSPSDEAQIFSVGTQQLQSPASLSRESAYAANQYAKAGDIVFNAQVDLNALV